MMRRLLLLGTVAVGLAGCAAPSPLLPFDPPAETLVPLRLVTCPRPQAAAAAATSCAARAG